MIVQGQRIILGRNGALRIIQQAGGPNGAVFVPGGAEQIWQACVVADRMLIGTSTGRLVALEPSAGTEMVPVMESKQ